METAAQTGFWELTAIMVVIASWILYRYVAPAGILGQSVEMVIGYGFLFLGVSLLVEGWREVYLASRAGRLATDRLYGVVRHPQYLGIFVALFGELVHWPTLPTLVLFPVIVWAYVRLARKEEARMPEASGDEYRAYQARVPMLVPRWGEWRRLLHETRPQAGDGTQARACASREGGMHARSGGRCSRRGCERRVTATGNRWCSCRPSDSRHSFPRAQGEFEFACRMGMLRGKPAVE